MANTYTQMYVHLVFAVKGRESLIHKSHREEIQKYITGIITNHSHKLIAIYCMPDHIHILIGLHPEKALSDLVREIKSMSTAFINSNGWLPKKFQWQTGYGAFTYSRSQLNNVINYINNQEEHHRKRTFKEEYVDFLNKFEVNYKDEYLFEWI
jgi:putative transposase